MEFFEKVGETITNVGKEASVKVKEFAEIAGLKSQIHTCEEVMKKNYMEIGKIYYEKFGSQSEELFSKQCKAIENAEEGRKALIQKLNEIKNL